MQQPKFNIVGDGRQQTTMAETHETRIIQDALQEQIEGWKIKHYDHTMKHNAEGALVCKASINALEGFMARVREL